MELNTVRVFVNDINAAKDFYEKKLGIPVKVDGRGHGYCVFKSGSVDLVIETVPDDAPEEDRVMVGRFTGLSFSVSDIDAKYLELKTVGVHFTGLPEKQFWGGILATFQDPSGNQLQVVQLPADA